MLGEDGVEGSLVVIIAVDGRVVHAAHIHHGVACLQLGRVAGPNEGGRGVGGQEAQEVDSQSLIGVEVAARVPG